MGDRARQDGVNILAAFLSHEAEIEEKHPTETEAQRVNRYMQELFGWADKHFKSVIKARDLVTKAEDLSGCRESANLSSAEADLRHSQEMAVIRMRYLWNQFDHHTALHNAKPDKYPAVPVELKKLVDKLDYIWEVCRYQGSAIESMSHLEWAFEFLQDEIPKMKDLYEVWKEEWNRNAEPSEVGKEGEKGI
ncbi:hypothetical protein DL98DRAFT_591034 [Cadophora sp. DSE1049]|nr:hypothetical protein DL98DRAFT_591034 [Cadophora sp. DSE1049]